MILEENKVREFAAADFKTYYKATVNKTLWYFGRRTDKSANETQ